MGSAAVPAALTLLCLTGCPDNLLTFEQAAAADYHQWSNLARLDEVRLRLHQRHPGQPSTLFVKASFPVDRHGVAREWIWIQVVRWEDDLVEGVLVNEPGHVHGLHAGSYVKIDPGRIGDYQETLDDGTVEGNALDRVLGGRNTMPRPRPQIP